jgi:uncharacterized cupredoxin-like copper-binding protein
MDGTVGRLPPRLTRCISGLLLAVVVTSCVPPPRTTASAVTIRFHYSHFEPNVVTVPAGERVTFTLRNDDPIDHEWIVGPPEVHEVHRHGTEAFHGRIPTEVSVPAFTTRVTTITFDGPGEFAYICHLPGHEEYGMSGTVIVRSRE